VSRGDRRGKVHLAQSSPRRAQLIPWKAAGRVTERIASGDDVVRETGWVFNNATGDALTLAEFVATGDDEVPTYLETVRLRDVPRRTRGRARSSRSAAGSAA
jgi:hypothetical protein